jgi:beta-N-acetylhexosaminidase
MVFSPVLDFSLSQSDYIYNRTFQKNKTDSILTGLNMIKGYSLANIYSVPKHFPGYVNCEQDPHGLVCHNNFGVLKKSIDIFKEVLKLFKYDFIMFGHNIIKEFGDKPITKSEKFVNWFRKNINSDQIYVTDSIGMGSYINNETDYSKQALEAIKSGYDIIILPSNLYFSYQALDGLYSNLDDELLAKNINTSYNKLNKYIK